MISIFLGEHDNGIDQQARDDYTKKRHEKASVGASLLPQLNDDLVLYGHVLMLILLLDFLVEEILHRWLFDGVVLFNRDQKGGQNEQLRHPLLVLIL